jgi:hypothetical protein
MDQEKRDEPITDPNPNFENTNSEEKTNTPNKETLTDDSYNKGIEAIVEQIRLFEENVEKIQEVIDITTFSSNLENLKNSEESTRLTLKAIENSVRFNIKNSEIIKLLNELRETYFELNQEAVDVPNISVVSQSALLNDMDRKIDAAIGTQNKYIETLEKELIKKEDEMKQLRAIIEEKRKKDKLMI